DRAAAELRGLRRRERVGPACRAGLERAWRIFARCAGRTRIVAARRGLRSAARGGFIHLCWAESERGTSMNPCVKRIAAAAAVLIAFTGAAAAHSGHADAGGFAHGFMHPLGGLDHVLAMVAVGLYAALLGGRALWLVPAT